MEDLWSQMGNDFVREIKNEWERTARDMIKQCAQEWEMTELDKIKQRYEKSKERIDSWVDKKRKKAKRKLVKEQSELEERLKSLEKIPNKIKYVKLVADGANFKLQRKIDRQKLKSKRKFENKMKYVNLVAKGARDKAEERRKNEERQAKEKASTISTTGKLPQTYFCF